MPIPPGLSPEDVAELQSALDLQYQALLTYQQANEKLKAIFARVKDNPGITGRTLNTIGGAILTGGYPISPFDVIDRERLFFHHVGTREPQHDPSDHSNELFPRRFTY